MARSTLSCCDHRLWFNFFTEWQTLVGQSILLFRLQDHIHTHTHTQHSVWLLETGDQHIADLCLKTHYLNSVSHALGGFRTRNPSTWTAANPRLTTRSHSERAATLMELGCLCERGFWLTAWSRIHIEQLTGSQPVENFEVFMEQEGSLPHSQKPATCPYPEPPQSSPCPHFPNNRVFCIPVFCLQ